MLLGNKRYAAIGWLLCACCSGCSVAYHVSMPASPAGQDPPTVFSQCFDQMGLPQDARDEKRGCLPGIDEWGSRYCGSRRAEHSNVSVSLESDHWSVHFVPDFLYVSESRDLADTFVECVRKQIPDVQLKLLSEPGLDLR
jgi:hypothetical protein